jgi:FkbM family methyltransferase
MNVEEYILALIPGLLNRYDKSKSGATLDIGVGNFNFYFEKFHNSGYKTYAIEPLPSEHLRQVTLKNNVDLIEACVTDYNGEIDIYSGIFDNTDCSDVSSTNKNWWGVNSASRVSRVPAITLADIITKHKIASISYLKIDTEGSEFSIIQQLYGLPASILPKILEFEYGGGATKVTNKAGWDYEYFEKTLKCITACHDLNYRYLLVFDSSNDSPVEIDLDQIKNYSDIFKDTYIYGNVMAFQQKLFSFNEILKKMKQTLLQKILQKHR